MSASGFAALPIAWTRPEGEARNTRIPTAGPRIQDTVSPGAWTYYLTMREGSRSEDKSKLAGFDVFEPAGYRTLARRLRISARTALNRLNELREALMVRTETRRDAHGGYQGLTVITPAWSDVIRQWQADPAIAKTAQGYAIRRRSRFMTPDEAAACCVKSESVWTRPGEQPKPARVAPPAAEAVNVAGIIEVLRRFDIADDGRGALDLLAAARAQTADISPQELAEAMAAELDKRAEIKRRKRQTFAINVPYIGTFIRAIAGMWAANREERAREAARRAAEAVRDERRRRELALEQAYEAFTAEAMDRWIRALPADRYAAYLADAVEAARREYPQVARMNQADREELARRVIARDRRAEAGVPAFAAWVRTQSTESPPGAG